VLSLQVITSMEELQAALGCVISVSQWITVDQQLVDSFAELTGDRQWIHVDPERAKDSPFGGTIAQGMLTLAIASHLPIAERTIDITIPSKMTVNYGFNRIRFPSPVRTGDRIRTIARLEAAEQVAEGVIQLTRSNTVEIENSDRPALVSQNLSRLYIDVE
jgi:acyl dehydratase